MKIKLEDFYKYSYCISISDDRYKQFYEVFTKCGIQVPKRFNGIQFKLKNHPGCIISSNAFNCSLTHYMLVRLAQFNDFPFIVIFEDDACPLKNISQKLSLYLENIPDNCDILKLGYTKQFGKSKVFNNNYCILDAFGAHSYIVFKRFYNKYINMFNNCATSDNEIFVFYDKNVVLTTNENLFIQHNIQKDTIHNFKNQKFNQTIKIDENQYMI